MGKYNIKFSCGCSWKINLDEPVGKQLKVDWLDIEGICYSCYRNLESQKIQEFLALNWKYESRSQNEPSAIMWFSGNTFPYKELIKSLGYKWDYHFDEEKCWAKKVSKIDELRNEISLARNSGVRIVVNRNKKIDYKFLLKAVEINEIKKEKLEDIEQQERSEITFIERPSPPKLVNGTWNKKIYGRRGQYSIYVDGVKKRVHDEQYNELMKYKEELLSYADKVDLIEKEFSNKKREMLKEFSEIFSKYYHIYISMT